MDYFIGEIRAFPFGVVPQNWHVCDGSLLPIAAHSALYALLGAAYGGDGITDFGLPDLRGRAMLGQGVFANGIDPITYAIGQKEGRAPASISPPALYSATRDNRQPSLALNYCISLVGLFPARAWEGQNGRIYR